MPFLKVYNVQSSLLLFVSKYSVPIVFPCFLVYVFVCNSVCLSVTILLLKKNKTLFIRIIVVSFLYYLTSCHSYENCYIFSTSSSSFSISFYMKTRFLFAKTVYCLGNSKPLFFITSAVAGFGDKSCYGLYIFGNMKTFI